MLRWNDYVKQLLSSKSSFDGITLSFNNGSQNIGVPPIIKASILMLDHMLEHQGKYNIFVFPERVQSIFTFTLIKLLHNIYEGRIESDYDINKFVPGEKLKIGNAVAEFVRVEERDGEVCIIVKLSDTIYSAPKDKFPPFQKCNTKRLSKDRAFQEAIRQVGKKVKSTQPAEKHLQILFDHKTHMDRSIVYMSSMINAKNMLSDCKLCGQSLKDTILVGQADYKGDVKNIGAGQLGGIPAIVLATDLYVIREMVNRGHPIQSIIIDASNGNALLSQMDALDGLMRTEIPITCVTDTVNSFDLQMFEDREFSVWRWNETSITEPLYNMNSLKSDTKVENCVKHEVKFLTCEGKEISDTIQILYSNRVLAQKQSAKILNLFDKLFSLAFIALRETASFNDDQLSKAKYQLEECRGVISEEKRFIAPNTYEDYSKVISYLESVFSQKYVLAKNTVLAKLLKRERYRSVCIIVAERTDKQNVEKYWRRWCENEDVSTQIHVLYPAEYYSTHCAEYSTTIVVGWLKRAIMRKILFSFNTQSYTVLLYAYENRWKNYDVAKWASIQNICGNIEVIKKSFCCDGNQIAINETPKKNAEKELIPSSDEFAEIEKVLTENKYRQYIANGGDKNIKDTENAVPINYVGGYLAFYRVGHKVVSATNIIINDADKIDLVLPNDLKMGDFVVVREVDRDIIKEMADNILKEEGADQLRALASKWKEALEIELLFKSLDSIYQELQNVGCTKSYQAVRTWTTDTEMIAPLDKQDLVYIAQVTKNQVLKERIDDVYEAAQKVRSAHIQAGRMLSAQLRDKIVATLKEHEDIDPYNIWEPIEIQVPGIGAVRILKIIDIGSPVCVSTTDTNRLISEE